MNGAAFDASLLAWPMLAGLLVLSTHVPLGRRVLARGIIFLDLAVAQIAVLGVVAAHAFELAPEGWPTQAAAAAAALGGAAALAWCERLWPDIQEALIGSAFIVSASLAVVLLAHDPHGGEHLAELLTGQILWATPSQVLAIGALYAGLLVFWGMRAARPGGEGLGNLGFHLVFALAITASVQLVGVYLVFASLILPALAVRKLPARAGLVVGAAVGLLGYAVGLAASALFDLPAGPAIVLALAGAALVAARVLRVAATQGQR